MKSFGTFGIAFALLFAPPTKAETPFVIETAWIVVNNEWMVKNPVTNGVNLKLPEEIPADASWIGATVTNGNIIGTIIALPKPQDNVLSGFQEPMFRLRLRFNAIISSAFPNGFQMFPVDGVLYLISPELSKTNFDMIRLPLGNQVRNLTTKSHFGFIQYFPERSLLPTLPLEQENENEFVKKARKRSVNNYQDGQYVGTLDSVFMGIQRTNDGYTIVWEEKNITGASPSNTNSSPYFFGGFVDSEARFNLAFRVPFGKEFIDVAHFKIRIGATVNPPEEREDGKKHTFIFSATIVSELTEEEGYHMVRDGKLAVFYPKQLANCPDEDGVPCNEELNNINEELARSVLVLLGNVLQSLLPLDWSLPVDLALSSESNVLYLASTCPTTETRFDWNLAVQLIQSLSDNIRPMLSPDEPQTVSLFRMGSQNVSITVAGLIGYRLNVSMFGQPGVIIYVHEPGFFYAALLSLNGANEVSDEQCEAVQRRLGEKIVASRQAVVDKMPLPTTVLRSSDAKTKLRVDYEPTERGIRITVHTTQESFWNVLALVQMLGLNPLQILPFWQQ